MWALFRPYLAESFPEPYKPQRFFIDEAIFGEKGIRE
jgi:hypothetical protein